MILAVAILSKRKCPHSRKWSDYFIRNNPCEYDGVVEEVKRACKVLWTHIAVVKQGISGSVKYEGNDRSPFSHLAYVDIFLQS